jgi:hypothetical protein
MSFPENPIHQRALPPNKLFQAMALPALRSGKSTPERGCWAAV